MRLTVGPLAPAVYWRRRAVVLGAGLLFLIVIVNSCTGPGKSGAASDQGSSPTPTAGATATETVVIPESGAPASEQAGSPAEQVTDPTDAPTVPTVAPVADGDCTDKEISVIPVPSERSPQPGATIELRIRIKNISSRTCNRDVGAGPQELFVKRGAETVWSSDTCNLDRSSNVQRFLQSVEHEYRVSWNGLDSSRCDGEVASGDPLEPGEYQLFGRLGTKMSAPVKLTITA